MLIKRTALIALAFATCLLAQKPKLPGTDWVPLFNGKDLSGWVNVGSQKWVVENNVIHGLAISKSYGYLMTKKTYKDFQLGLRFKCEGSGNSGLFFHTDFKPGTAAVSQGLQFEIDCNINHHTAGIYGEVGQGWIVWPSPKNEPVVRQHDWNDLQVQVVGNHYVSRLNGVQMVDFTNPHPKSFDGHIALQLHAGGKGNMVFKDIYIRDLTKRE